MAGQQIKVTATDGGAFDAYLALPAEPPAPGLIMLHEIFGVTDWIKETADLFADEGFCVMAPDMFWRLEPNFVGDHEDAEHTERGRHYKAVLDHDKLAASRLEIDAAVAYYGTQIHEFLEEGKNLACPIVFHMGDHDDRVPAGLAEATRTATAGVPDVTIHTYDAGHAFANTHRPDYYSEAATRAAHARTFALFDDLR
jgi:carboxymethylenebutenolidase